MTCGMINMDEGTRREARMLGDSVNEQDNEETGDVNLQKGTDI